MTNHPNSEEQTQEIIGQLKASLSRLLAADLPPASSEIVNEALQKIDLLSQQVLASQEKSLQDLQMAQQEKNSFISIVTHELRLPMTSIKGYTDLLRQGITGPVNEQQLSFLDTIRNNVDRMSSLLSSLSDISRIDTGRMKLDITAIHIEQPLETVLQNLRPAWEKKGQTVELSLQADLQPVSADLNRLTQVITNLLQNAIMYTPHGGKIHIYANQEDEQLRLKIEDNGIGIKAEDQARLFSPFFRSDDLYVRDQPGWGISLHVSSKLIQIMGGSIGMYSEGESGSIFWFSLPLYQGS